MPTTLAYGVAAPAYRLPSATRVGTVRLQVADLVRSLDWYGRVLGLEVREREQRFAALGATGGDEALVELHELPGATPVPRRGRLGLYHFAILLPSRAALGAFVRHLGEVGERAGMSDHLVSEAVYLSDPDGLGIEVYADRPRSEWRAENGQLIMATDPLDVADLTAAADPAGWSGMPRETTIGHVHLFVEDLPRVRGVLSCRPRPRQDGLGLSGRAVHVRGRLPPSPGHQYLGRRRCPPPPRGMRGCSSGSCWCRGCSDAAAAIDSLERNGAAVARDAGGGTASDPWGTTVRVRAEGA